MHKDKITRLRKGLNKDNNPVEQPEDTYRFALNAVNESDKGDYFSKGNANSNKQCAELPRGYTPIGDVYVGDDNTVIFSVSDIEDKSEIGIIDCDCNYRTLINGDLCFKLSNQIQAVYRLRRGCERVIYWVDGLNRPRQLNIDKIENYYIEGTSNLDVSKFQLQRVTDLTPKISVLEVLDSGGQLPPSSIGIGIQYLDEDFNPTNFVETFSEVIIYNDSISNEFTKIQGSNIGGDEYDTYGNTSKAIKIVLDPSSIDTSFPYYRFAFSEASSGSGVVNTVRLSNKIPTDKLDFTYTGVNYVSETTLEEVQAFRNVIESADHIEQVQNRLVLANTKGDSYPLCELQKYASRIKVDVKIHEVISNDLEASKRNPKNPTKRYEGVGYMPGEIYALGIVYTFNDGTTSPAYHIPGKNPTTEGFAFVGEDNVFPMGVDNSSDSDVYVDNNNCSGLDGYWGRDSEGSQLTGEAVRHHRFPLRSELNVPLVEKVITNSLTESFQQVVLNVSGFTPTPCSQEDIDFNLCTTILDGPEDFQVQVVFEVEGVEYSMLVDIEPELFVNPSNNIEIDVTEYSDGFNVDASSIIITKILEFQPDGSSIDILNGGTSTKNLTYVGSVEPFEYTSENVLHKTNILGLKVSNVDVPFSEGGKSKEVVGYYIVRLERSDDNKTILDSAVLLPTRANRKYISSGLLSLEGVAPNRRTYGLLTPENKFFGKRLVEFDEILHQGSFEIEKRMKSKFRYQDVSPGSSFDEDQHKGSDNDGFSLKTITRDNVVFFRPEYEEFNITKDEIKKVFYLDALESRDFEEDRTSVWNTSADNKIGFVYLKDNDTKDNSNKYPYVYLKRNLENPYTNYLLDSYIKVSQNVHDINNSEATVFGGDTYISPMRYSNSVFWDNRIAVRLGKKGFFKKFFGGLLLVAGAVLVLTGIGAAAGALVLASGLAVLGGGALLLSSGIKQDNINKAYQDEYKKGLRETNLDSFVNDSYRDLGPEDDEIQWIGDVITDLWFESQINIGLRYKLNTDTPSFLPAPGSPQSGNTSAESTGCADRDVFGNNNGDLCFKDYTIAPATDVDRHFAKKLTSFNPDRKGGREYIGHPLGELYSINKDYIFSHKTKLFFSIPLEYDCCSECLEDFPHRVWYSQQSFQEESSDNYRVFLPNNYTDIEGHKGEITNVFRWSNNLYIHTEEALWHLPENIQERVTNDIVSFIGTGDFFSIPPRLILNEQGHSAGCTDKWATEVTKFNIFFVSEREGKIHSFNGNSIKPISDIGLNKWFRENLPLYSVKDYYSKTKREFPFYSNPSNQVGVGYISTYDTNKERIIITKKDYKISDSIPGGVDDFHIENCGGQLVVFNDYGETIDQYAADGWQYLGVVDCEMKFRRVTYEVVEETRFKIINLPNTADVWVVLDLSGSLGNSSSTRCLQSIHTSVNAWESNYRGANPLWTGNFNVINSDDIISDEDQERYLRFPDRIISNFYGGNPSGVDLFVISFINEAADKYHSDNYTPSSAPSETSSYLNDKSIFINTYNQLSSFRGLMYPIVFNNDSGSCATFSNLLTLNKLSKQFLKQVIGAVEGFPVGEEALEKLKNNRNPAFTEVEWEEFILGIESFTTFSTEPLKDYGWVGNWTKYKQPNVPIITPEQFQIDMEEALRGTPTVEEKVFSVAVPVEEFETVAGTVIDTEDFIGCDNSWTMSFSLKSNDWVSWHSYLPNYYYKITEKFYSWIHGSNYMWEHNVKGKFQTYYGTLYPFTIEYVSVSNPIINRIWEDISFHTDARKYYDKEDWWGHERYVTFNKAIVYNSRQCTGEMDLKVKDTETTESNYLSQQVVNMSDNSVFIDTNEEDWNLNDLRDIRIDYSSPIWINDPCCFEDSSEYRDKILNDVTLDVNKDWTQLESMRDKYLIVRLIFNNFDDVKLILNYTVESETVSVR